MVVRKTKKDDEIVVWNTLGRIAMITDFQCCNFMHRMSDTCSDSNFLCNYVTENIVLRT